MNTLGTSLGGVSAPAAVMFYGLIARRLRILHSAVWQTLGSPAQTHDPTQVGSLLLRDFIWKAGWCKVSDSVLSVLCVAFIVAGVTAGVALVAAFVAKG
jgi:hypothetical protein